MSPLIIGAFIVWVGQPSLSFSFSITMSTIIDVNSLSIWPVIRVDTCFVMASCKVSTILFHCCSPGDSLVSMAWSSWSTSIISWSSSVAETRHYEFGEYDHCLYTLFVTSLLQSISARKKSGGKKISGVSEIVEIALTACCSHISCHVGMPSSYTNRQWGRYIIGP